MSLEEQFLYDSLTARTSVSSINAVEDQLVFWHVIRLPYYAHAVSCLCCYPLHLISDILCALGKARYYTTVALASGFHQIPLREEDHQKTAFSTPGGHIQVCSMPTGICSASDIFQRLRNTVLSGPVGTKALIYLDDTVTWGATVEEVGRRIRLLTGPVD